MFLGSFELISFIQVWDRGILKKYIQLAPMRGISGLINIMTGGLTGPIYYADIGCRMQIENRRAEI